MIVFGDVVVLCFEYYYVLDNNLMFKFGFFIVYYLILIFDLKGKFLFVIEIFVYLMIGEEINVI